MLDATVNVEVVFAPVEETVYVCAEANVIPLVVAETSKVAPDALITPVEFAIEPEPDNASVPAFMVVEPLYKFAVVKVNVPLPALVKDLSGEV